MRQRLPHVSGRELSALSKQIKDLQHKQHQQTLQTLRLAQVQEKQTFKYLDSALKGRGHGSGHGGHGGRSIYNTIPRAVGFSFKVGHFYILSAIIHYIGIHLNM